MRIVFLALVSIAALVLPGFTHAETTAEMKEARLARWVRAGLLDPKVPTEQRREIVAELEAIAKDDSQTDVLYLLGSLYRQSPAQSSSPVEQNIDRARELLSRAALHGKVVAMAKLSLIELQAGNEFEANTWAQLYYHYELDREGVELALEGGFAAMILRKAIERFPEERTDELESAVGEIIAKYDSQILGPRKERTDSTDPVRFANEKMGSAPIGRYDKGRRIETGVAEYVIELDANGMTKNVWVLDSWPDPRLAGILRKKVLGFKWTSNHPASTVGKVFLMPVTFDPGQYSMHPQSGKD